MRAIGLCEFAHGFREVGAWREAMLARRYTIPPALCQGLDQAMTKLDLTFPQAFRLLWDHRKILVSGSALIYDQSAVRLWEPGPGAAVQSPVDPTGPVSALEGDVLSHVPLPDDILELERLRSLSSDASPLELLLLWRPVDKGDRYLRCFLLDFGHRVLEAERRRANP